MHDGPVLWLGRDGAAWPLTEQQRTGRTYDGGAHTGDLLSPMPGSVIAVHVAEGETVEAGQPLLIVEAMKMEHVIVAPHEGVVSAVEVRTGDQVIFDQLLATVTPVGEHSA